MEPAEIVYLTQAMLDAGDRLNWPYPIVVDKHCVGGLPGNRTTPIVVAIVAATDVPMPKTSSRAITSPAGTADAMETMAPVNLSLDSMRRVVDREGGCVVWGGAVQLSPADDVLVRVERALDIDSEAQLIASILSKKAAAGSTHVVIDIPVGPTAKVRDAAAPAHLSELLSHVGKHVGLHVTVVEPSGAQPVGRGIGPALEAHDVLAVLNNTASAPDDLRQRAVMLAGRVLDMTDMVDSDQGETQASSVLIQGKAWEKFQAICEAQGGMRIPPVAKHRRDVPADRTGHVMTIDNRRLAKVAKLAGAPMSAAAGLELHVKVGDRIAFGDTLLSIHAESAGELAYAMNYLDRQADVIAVS